MSVSSLSSASLVFLGDERDETDRCDNAASWGFACEDESDLLLVEDGRSSVVEREEVRGAKSLLDDVATMFSDLGEIQGDAGRGNTNVGLGALSRALAGNTVATRAVLGALLSSSSCCCSSSSLPSSFLTEKSGLFFSRNT